MTMRQPMRHHAKPQVSHETRHATAGPTTRSDPIAQGRIASGIASLTCGIASHRIATP